MFKVRLDRIETFMEPILVVVIAIVVGRALSWLIRRYIRKSARVMKFDPTNYSFLQNAVSFIVFILAVLFVFYKIPQLHTIGKTLFAGAGIIAAVIGFASQEAFSNIISGIFIVIFKPFSVGDHIKLLSNNHVGVVEDITIRHTILKSIENRRIVIPNSLISREAIMNSTIKDERVMFNLEVVIAYENDIDRALWLLQDEAAHHRDFLDVRRPVEKDAGKPAVAAKVVALEDNGLRCRAYVWARNNDVAFDMKCDLLKSVKERFEKEGVKLSYAQRLMGIPKAAK
ncbi:MAG: mechanosensitive ion channel family protein [Chitinophagales bacterium]